MARYTRDSRERVRDAVDFVELVGARTELKPAGPRRMTGPVPVPRGADAVVRHRPGREALPLLRLRGGRRHLHVRHGDGGARLRHGARVARRAREHRARARDRGPARDRAPAGARAAPGAARAHRRLLRARPVGVGRGGPGARIPGRARARGGRAARVPGRLRAARVGAGDRRLDRRRLHAGRAAGGGPRLAAARGAGAARPVPRPDHVPARRPEGPRARLRRAGAVARRQPEVPQHVGVRPLPQGHDRLRGGPRTGGGGAGRAASCSSRATPT